jgi:hypothetical protein
MSPLERWCGDDDDAHTAVGISGLPAVVDPVEHDCVALSSRCGPSSRITSTLPSRMTLKSTLSVWCTAVLVG